jgi:hypothetical protein
VRSLSRRDFFKHFSDGIKDQVDLGSTKDIVSAVFVSEAKTAEAQWFNIGRVAQMTPGAMVKSIAGQIPIILFSDQVGVRAEASDGRCIALRAEPNGALMADPTQTWPAGRVLSHLSNQPIDLDNTKEHKLGDSNE